MAMASASSASRSTTAVARGTCFVDMNGFAFNPERFCFRRTSSLLRYSPRSGSPDYSPETPEYAPLMPSAKRTGSPDYSPSSPEYTPLTPSQRSGSPEYSPATLEYAPSSERCGSPDYSPSTTTPEYTPLTPSQHSGSPDYTPATLEYTPLTPSQRPGSPDYTPTSAMYTLRSRSGCCLSDYFADRTNDMESFYYASSCKGYSLRGASPEYTPGSPSGRYSPDYSTSPFDAYDDMYASPSWGYSVRAVSPEYTPCSPEYTPLSPPRRAASPEYTPLSLPRRASLPDYTPSSVSDAESRTSPACRRPHHPYQRNQTSSGWRRHSFSQHGY